eukprot:s5261_g1.t1
MLNYQKVSSHDKTLRQPAVQKVGASEKKEDDDLRKTLTYDPRLVVVDAFLGLSDGSLSLSIHTPGEVSTYSVEDHLARTVECWRNIQTSCAELGKLRSAGDLASVVFPQKYLVDDLGHLRLRRSTVESLNAVIPLGLAFKGLREVFTCICCGSLAFVSLRRFCLGRVAALPRQGDEEMRFLVVDPE